MMILVIAPHYRAFQHWCRGMEMSAHQANLRYIARPDQLQGYRADTIQIVFLWGWTDNAQWRRGAIDVQPLITKGAEVFDFD